MTEAHAHVDKPEPRWQALLAMAAVGGVYLALPRELVIGPTWLLPTVIAVLLVPTIVTHRMGRHSFNHALGIVNDGTANPGSRETSCMTRYCLPYFCVVDLRLTVGVFEIADLLAGARSTTQSAKHSFSPGPLPGVLQESPALRP
jgi:hypothetical protein